MPSQKKIEANRRNARNGTGPRTHAGKARSSRNSFRHGLSATVNDADGNRKIERLRDLLCGEDAGEAEHHEATIVAECQVLVARVRAARVIAIESVRTSAIPPFVPAYVIEQKTDELLDQLEHGDMKSLCGKLRRMVGKAVRVRRACIDEQFRCWRSFGGTLTKGRVVTHRNGERVPRSDCESTLLALPQLQALDRYEKRALSRRRYAIKRLQAIQHLAGLQRTHERLQLDADV